MRWQNQEPGVTSDPSGSGRRAGSRPRSRLATAALLLGMSDTATAAPLSPSALVPPAGVPTPTSRELDASPSPTPTALPPPALEAPEGQSFVSRMSVLPQRPAVGDEVDRGDRLEPVDRPTGTGVTNELPAQKEEP